MAAGLPRLQLDGEASLRLPDDDPIRQRTAQVEAATGGDRLLALVARDPQLFSAEGLARVAAARAVLESAPGVARVASLDTFSVPAEVDGAVTGRSPLPAPGAATPATWAAARREFTADPLALGALISPDGRTTAVVGWVDERSGDATLVATVQRALSAQPGPAEAEAVRKAIGDARLAVILGQTEGPPDAAAARAIRALSSPPWLTAAAAAALEEERDPMGAALAALQEAELPPGWGIAGPRATEAVLARRLPVATGQALAGLLAVFGLVLAASGGRRVSPSLAAPVAAFGGCLGASGWLGLALGPLPVAAGLAAAATAVVVDRGHPVAALPLLGALVGSGWAPAGPALAAAAAAGLTSAWLLAGRELTVPEPPTPRATAGLAAATLALVAGFAAATTPLGQDAATLIDRRTAEGLATARLADAGAAPGAVAVLHGEPGAALDPAALAGLRVLQDRLELDEAVLGTASWADLLARIREAVVEEAGLPGTAEEAEQLLLVFDRPEATRPLVALDRSLAVARLRLAPGGGAHLARLAEAVPGLAGGGVEIAVAAARRTRGMLWGLVVGALFAVGLRRERSPALRGAAGAAVAAATAGAWAGTLGPEGCLAAAVAGGAGLVGGGRWLAVAAVGLLPLGLHPWVPGQGMLIGLGAAAVALVALERLD